MSFTTPYKSCTQRTASPISYLSSLLPSPLLIHLHGLDVVRILLHHDATLELERRCELLGGHGEVAGEDGELLDLGGVRGTHLQGGFRGKRGRGRREEGKKGRKWG